MAFNKYLKLSTVQRRSLDEEYWDESFSGEGCGLRIRLISFSDAVHPVGFIDSDY
jgi:hypothetical protein